MTRQLELDFTRAVEPVIEIRRSPRRRTLTIEVHPDLRVILRVPARCPEPVAQAFLASRTDWVSRQIEHFRKQAPLREPVAPTTGMRLRLLGEEIRLQRQPESKSLVEFGDGELRLGGRHVASERAVAVAVVGWFQREARTRFEALVDCWHAHPKFAKYGRPTLRIRAMRTRWGSLSPRTGMTLNLLLIHCPLPAIEYVVVHELCHLRYHGHGKAFYGLLESVLPDWRERKKLLERGAG